MRWTQSTTSTRFSYGSSTVAFYWNIDKQDVDVFMRGTTDNNALVINAGDDSVNVGTAS